ncbi:MAG: glycosyltransferase [Planctomycetaceae bacterium]|nr:glycosyltransferase [Planctomycetaceae bacterium]
MKTSVALIVHNELDKLRDLLPCLSGFDEIVVFDLQSTDGSGEFCRRFGCRVIRKPINPIAETYYSELLAECKNDWVLKLDPDEMPGTKLTDFAKDERELEKLTLGNIAIVAFPWVFHFKRRKLSGTFWGGIHRKPFLLNRKRVDINPYVHKGFAQKQPFVRLNFPECKSRLEESEDYQVRHFWIDSWKQFFEKHFRYLRAEGESRFNTEKKLTVFGFLRKMLKVVRTSLRPRNLLRDGLDGILLSLAWIAYQFMAHLNQIRVQWRGGRQAGL